MSANLRRWLGPLLRWLPTFHPDFSSKKYWLDRYRHGGNSGAGSYSHLAAYKADVLNNFVINNQVSSVIEFGCGDGNQLKLATYREYTGLDISPHAIEICRKAFHEDETKRFIDLSEYRGETAKLALSLDVVFHLVEDSVFDDYMRRLFDAATRFVIVYSSNTDQNPKPLPRHVRHRMFTRWVSEHRRDWTLKDVLENRYPYDGNPDATSFANFHIYESR